MSKREPSGEKAKAASSRPEAGVQTAFPVAAEVFEAPNKPLEDALSSCDLRVLVVCHCYRKDGDVIRIISARKADRSERLVYAERSNT